MSSIDTPSTSAEQGGSPSDSTITEHPAVARVITSLNEAGATGGVVVLGEHARTAVAAAEQLGVEVAQIANSLIFTVADPAAPQGKRAVLVLTSGAHRVDTAKVATALGVAALGRADANFVKERTGFVIGGVAPIGHLEPVQTVVDNALAEFDQVWAAAGHARTVFPTSYDELLRITSGIALDVA